MATKQYLPIISVVITILSLTLAEPVPGRIPKVYNALITSNQNLEPSKAFPVYQPVLHNAIPFPYQPIVYGDFPLSPGLYPAPVIPVPAQDLNNKPQDLPTSPSEAPTEASPSEETSPKVNNPEPNTENPTQTDKEASPPLPPSTESPIPLNEFGLPPQILPLSRINPEYDLTQFNTFPYTYSYPTYRFYDPYLPFGYNPYASYPIYQPLNNFVSQYSPKGSIPESVSPVSTNNDVSTPPPEPLDLNVLNYSAKDPAIPNVPPPPLPQGGLKPDKE